MKIKNQDQCCIKGCKGEPVIGYYEYPICQKHWNKHCDETDKFNLKQELNIEK